MATNINQDPNPFIRLNLTERPGPQISVRADRIQFVEAEASGKTQVTTDGITFSVVESADEVERLVSDYYKRQKNGLRSIIDSATRKLIDAIHVCAPRPRFTRLMIDDVGCQSYQVSDDGEHWSDPA